MFKSVFSQLVTFRLLGWDSPSEIGVKIEAFVDSVPSSMHQRESAESIKYCCFLLHVELLRSVVHFFAPALSGEEKIVWKEKWPCWGQTRKLFFPAKSASAAAKNQRKIKYYRIEFCTESGGS